MPRKDRPILKGSFDEKLKQVENYMRRANRQQNYVIGVTPPIPVFDWKDQPDDDGVVFRKLMPGNGKITVGCIYIETLDKKLEPKAVLTIEGRLGGSNVNIPLDRQMLSLQPNMPVEFGQRLTLAIDPIEACSGIWTAFLFEVDMSQTKKDKQLVEGFLALVEEVDADLDEES
jgi:hypothetical protein